MKPIKHYYTASDAEVKAAIDKVANQGKAKWIHSPPLTLVLESFLRLNWNDICILVSFFSVSFSVLFAVASTQQFLEGGGLFSFRKIMLTLLRVESMLLTYLLAELGYSNNKVILYFYDL